MAVRRLVPWVGAALLVSACATASLRHPSFIEVNVARLRHGLHVEDVRALFGEPDRTEVMRCGEAVGEPWPCMVWTYSLTGGYTNLLVFRSADGALALDSWLLGRVYDKGYTAGPGQL